MTDDTPKELKVIPFKAGMFPSPVALDGDVEGPYHASLPDDEMLNTLSRGRPLKAIVAVLMNDQGEMAEYVDGATHLERIAMLEISKHMAIALGDPS